VIFIFCRPLGLALLWVFQQVMKLPLISLASQSHQQRLAPLSKQFRWGGVARFGLIVASLLLGAISHLAWDAFTHDRGLVVRNLPDMRVPLEEFGTHRPLYNVLQHGSTLLGLALLVFWYWRWFKRTPPQPVPLYLQTSIGMKRWIVGSILAFSTSLAGVYAYSYSYHLASLGLFVGAFVVTCISLIYISTLGYSLWWHRTATRLITNH
jgi:hypothetical protein